MLFDNCVLSSATQHAFLHMVFEDREFGGILAGSGSVMRSSDPLENLPESLPGAEVSSSRLFAESLFDEIVKILMTG